MQLVCLPAISQSGIYHPESQVDKGPQLAKLVVGTTQKTRLRTGDRKPSAVKVSVYAPTSHPESVLISKAKPANTQPA